MERGSGQKLVRTDVATAVAMFVIAIALRMPFCAQYAYHWDSAQFVLAIREYDIRLSQPHAPGYFLYIMLGRLVNVLASDPHTSLVWISVVFGSALPAVVYFLGTAMFGKRAGMVAGLLALTSPQVWFHSCVALTYCVDSFLVCALVFALWRATERGGRWSDAITIGALLAMIGGVREQSVPLLLPLVAVVFWRFKQSRILKLVVVCATAVGLGLLWFVPMVRMTGGLATYLQIVRLHGAFNAPATFLGGGWDALNRNVANVTGFCWNGLWLGGLVLVGVLFHRTFRMTHEQKREWENRYSPGLAFLSLWIIPMMFFGIFVGFTKQPGYVLSYLPAWFLVIGAVVGGFKASWQRVALIVLMCVGNVAAFAAWPPQWDGVFLGMGRTAREISQHDAELARTVRTIRQSYSPGNVVLCFSDEYYLYGLRHFQVYLPEYEQYQFAPDRTSVHPSGKSQWAVRDGHLEFVSQLDLSGKEGVVLMVPPGEKVEIFAPNLSLASAEVLPGTGNSFYFIPAKAVKLSP